MFNVNRYNHNEDLLRWCIQYLYERLLHLEFGQIHEICNSYRQNKHNTIIIHEIFKYYILYNFVTAKYLILII